MRVFCDATARMLRREVNAVTRAAEKHTDPPGLRSALVEYYGGHEPYMHETILPAAEALADLLCPTGATAGLSGQIRLAIGVWARTHTGESLVGAVDAAGGGTLQATLADWSARRGPEEASRLVGLITSLCEQSRGASQ